MALLTVPLNANATNNFGVAQLIVDPTPGKGTHTSITNALTVAVSGQTIFIRPGTYTESFNLPPGINLTAFDCDALTPNVTINGTISMTGAGASSISGINLQGTGSYAISVTGSAATILNLTQCYFNCLNFIGIFFNNTNTSAQLKLSYCQGNIATPGLQLAALISTGTTTMEHCTFTNSGGSTAASGISQGNINLLFCHFYFPIQGSPQPVFNIAHCTIDCSALNTTALLLSGTGDVCNIIHSEIKSGNATAINIINSAVLIADQIFISSSAANVITGDSTGTIEYGVITFTGNSTITSTTQIPFVTKIGTLATETPYFSMNVQTFTTTGTYTPTAGMAYCIIEVLGGGGGAGGTTANSGNNQSTGGGGAGGYAKALYTTSQIGSSQAVTINSGGSGGVSGNHNGSAGGSVSVGSLISATGGGGSPYSDQSGIEPSSLGGSGGTGTVTTGTKLVATTGQNGTVGTSSGSGQYSVVGNGGSSIYGSGANGPVSQDTGGNNAAGYGSGGSGCYSLYSNQAGGAGTNGYVVITEYIL